MTQECPATVRFACGEKIIKSWYGPNEKMPGYWHVTREEIVYEVKISDGSSDDESTDCGFIQTLVAIYNHSLEPF